MQLMILEVFAIHWLEGAEPNVQSDVRDTGSGRADAREDLGREMETGCGSSHRAALAGDNALVTVAIFGTVLAFDVGGQRHMPDAIDGAVNVFILSEKTDGSLAAFSAGENFRREA